MSTSRSNIWIEIGVTVLILGFGTGVPVYGFAGGTGEPNDPYQIATAADLLSIDSDPNLRDRHYVLIRDIDLDPNLPGGRVFDDALIARDTDAKVDSTSSVGFSGVFDGQGHTIWRLCISGKYGHAAGLFGSFRGFIKDLHLKEIRVSGAPCGALVGIGSSGGMILRCSVSGQVSGSNFLGGLVGGAFSPMILHCESRADVYGDKDSIAGGLVGSTYGQACQVIECHAAGTVIGGKSAGGLIGSSTNTAILRCAAVCQVTAIQVAGGLTGNGPNGGAVADCCARGRVVGAVAGGLIGTLEGAGVMGGRILNSYAACEMLGSAGGNPPSVLGGLFGKKRSFWEPIVVLACVWDTEVSPVSVGVGAGSASLGAGLTTKQMQQQDVLQQAGWDFGYTWIMPENDYPVLRWELAQAGGQKARN